MQNISGRKYFIRGLGRQSQKDGKCTFTISTLSMWDSHIVDNWTIQRGCEIPWAWGWSTMYVRLIGQEFVIPMYCPQFWPQFWPVSRVENSQEPTTSTGRETPLVDLCKSTDPLHWSLIIGQTLLLEGIMRLNSTRPIYVCCLFQSSEERCNSLCLSMNQFSSRRIG